MFVNKHFANPECAISHEMKGVIMRNLCGTIFYKKTNVLHFRICMSVPLTRAMKKKMHGTRNFLNSKLTCILLLLI